MQKICSKCKNEKPIEAFSCTKRNQNGTCKYYNSQCNACRTKYAAEKTGRAKKKTGFYNFEVKECLHCNKILSHSNFSPSIKGTCGLSSYCRECANSKFKQPLEIGRRNTAKYRLKHRERYLAKHRVQQYNRKRKIKATNDGTITDEYLKFLYEQEICCWCGVFTVKSERTLEHIVELNNGGTHSIHNTNMACLSCNSKRINKSDTKRCDSLFSKFIEQQKGNPDDNYS